MFGSLFSSVYSGLFSTTAAVLDVSTLGLIDLNSSLNHGGGSDDDPVIGQVDEPQTQAQIAREAVLNSDFSSYRDEVEAVERSDSWFYSGPTPASLGVKTGSNRADYFFGSNGDDKYFGRGGDDYMSGGVGMDRLNGGSGNDRIYGGDGQDILEGGSGRDVLSGGDGVDIFVFRKGDGETRIEDFELGYDILDLEDFTIDTAQAYEWLVNQGQQYGDDVYFDLGWDKLILENAQLDTMIADDLCIR